MRCRRSISSLIAVLLGSYALTMLSGCGTPSFLITPVANTNTLSEETVLKGNGAKIAIIDVEGMLANARKGGLLQPTENDLSLFTQELDKAAEDGSVKAVVLRVNSPGGTVTTSDTMYELVQRFKAKTHKPVVASAQEIAASGAYYVSCSADRIVACPTSLVGSIGVIFENINAQGTLQKLGLTVTPIKSAPLKDMASPFSPLGDQEKAIMQAMVDEYYARFIHIVTTNRHLTDAATIRLVTDGRVFTGEQARKAGPGRSDRLAGRRHRVGPKPRPCRRGSRRDL